MSGRELSRRGVLRAGGLALTAVAVSVTQSGCGGSGFATTSSGGSAGRLLPSSAPLPEPFRVPLPVPEVLRPVRSSADTDFYEVTQRVGTARILPGRTTRVWGYNGTFPGPTIVSRRGRRTVVTHRNELPVPTVVHLHGGRTAPEHDGYPTDLIMPVGGLHHPKGADAHGAHHGAPGGSPGMGEHGPLARGVRSYVYDLDQPAATLWYHDHRMDFTGPSVWRGLAGFHLHRDDLEDGLGLPSGDREVPLMIADRSFAEDGSLQYPSLDRTLLSTPGVTSDYMSGVLGDVILVNGAPWPVLDVAATTYRFRILNASNSRRYTLRLQDGPPLVQIGSDLGLLDRPVTHREIDIAQAERFDVIVDFSGHDIGDEITMTNERGDGGTAQVMRFRVTREPGAGEQPRPLPDRLVALDRLSLDDVVAEREFRLGRKSADDGMELWTINNETFSPDTVLARPRLGTVEKWTIRGLDAEHPFHIHLAPFQVISRGDTDKPGPYNAGWKDTVNLDEGFMVQFLIRFDGHRGKYVFHCHNLEHEDMMMMANFEVI